METQAITKFEFKSAEAVIPVTTITDAAGNPWWVAHEVCEVLGYSDTVSNVVNRHCKNPEILKGVESTALGFSPRGVLLIKESDLYRLIMRSNAEAAGGHP